MDRRTLIAATVAGATLTAVGGAGAATRSREIMGLGWYVVFSPPSRTDEVTDFYGKTLGLPLMMTMRTPQQNKNYFWCGEDIVLDLSHHAPETPLGRPRSRSGQRRARYRSSAPRPSTP